MSIVSTDSATVGRECVLEEDVLVPGLYFGSDLCFFDQHSEEYDEDYHCSSEEPECSRAQCSSEIGVHGVPDFTTDPAHRDPNQIEGQVTLFQSFSRAGIKPASRVHSPDRFQKIEDEQSLRRISEKFL
jgi:hypothetical protein